LIALSRTDPQQFGTIFERHFDTIHRYLSRRIGASLADELAAQTFVEAFASRGRFDRRYRDAQPWLFGIATNLLRRHHRLERRQLQAYARQGVDPISTPDVDAILSRVDADTIQTHLASALAELKRPDRDALLLYAWADLSYQEIAVALNVPVGTVRSRIHRARRITRSHLDLPEDQPVRPRIQPAPTEV
jgi:RNA polymerase sigma factor (sigma-70 family)